MSSHAKDLAVSVEFFLLFFCEIRWILISEYLGTLANDATYLFDKFIKFNACSWKTKTKSRFAGEMLFVMVLNVT